MTTGTQERMVPRAGGGPIAASHLRGDVLLTHDTAVELVAAATKLQETVRTAKTKFYETVDAYQDLILERYGVRLGGRRGGIGITSLDDTLRVEVSVADYQRVNAAIGAAEALMTEILDDLTTHASMDLRTLVTEAFQRDERTKRINVQTVLGLTRLELQHPRWPDAVRAIRDAIEPAGSRRYIRFYSRKTPTDPWRQIDVNFSSL